MYVKTELESIHNQVLSISDNKMLYNKYYGNIHKYLKIKQIIKM
jgi:hypothetical protein